MDTQAEILALLKRFGMKVTRQRERILTILLESDARLTAEDIYLQLKEHQEEFGLSTVYRTLAALAEHGILQRTDLPDSPSQYFNLSHKGHRHQLVCTRCKRTILLEECPAEAALQTLCEKYGFQITGHSFEIFGICPECQQLEGHHV